MTGMTREELLSLPASVDLATTARALGLGKTLTYALARRQELPVKVLRLGNVYRVATADILAVLGVERDAPSLPQQDPRWLTAVRAPSRKTSPEEADDDMSTSA